MLLRLLCLQNRFSTPILRLPGWLAGWLGMSLLCFLPCWRCSTLTILAVVVVAVVLCSYRVSFRPPSSTLCTPLHRAHVHRHIPSTTTTTAAVRHHLVLSLATTERDHCTLTETETDVLVTCSRCDEMQCNIQRGCKGASCNPVTTHHG